MALLTLPYQKSSQHKQAIQNKPSSYNHANLKKQEMKNQKQKQPSSWDQIKNLLSCKQVEDSNVHNPSKNLSKFGSSCSSICSFKDVVHGNTKVVHRADNSPEGSTVSQESRLLSRKTLSSGLSARLLQGDPVTSHGCTSYGSRAMQFRKLSGCYECRMIVDPTRYPIARTTICSCSQCGEIFPRMESLELHQKIKHAVSELGPDDSGRHIVEIIFKSSWFKNDNLIHKVERILKIHNTQRTIQRFEDCREAIKSRALNGTKKDPRCAADGNELLRFHCTTLACTLGANGGSALCSSIPGCGVCSIIRHSFKGKEGKGIRTTTSSGKAHGSCRTSHTGQRAMLVCRVIAGRVKRVEEIEPQLEENGSSRGSYDSIGINSNLEELFVFNPRAILPCFVVIYKTL